MVQRFPHQRQQRMAELIAQRGSLSVAALRQHFGASDPTIRRDLSLLEQAGLAVRTHGGVVAPRVGEATEPLFLEKLRLHQGAKKRIGKAAASLVANRQNILLDSGTTILAMAQVLAGRPVNIVALDLKVAEAAAVGATQVTTPGGQVRNGYYSIVGSQAIAALAGLSFDYFFMSADAIDAGGVSNSVREEAEVKQAAMARARETVVLADHSKLNRRSLVPVCSLDRVAQLITDRAAARRLGGYDGALRRIDLC